MLKDLVILAKWSHLFPSRTQQLSTLASTISRPALVKIDHRQLIKTLLIECLFLCCNRVYINSSQVINDIIEKRRRSDFMKIKEKTDKVNSKHHNANYYLEIPNALIESLNVKDDSKVTLKIKDDGVLIKK